MCNRWSISDTKGGQSIWPQCIIETQIYGKPFLSHKTPRVLACTKAGRVKVADWLKYIENGAAKSGTADPMGTYDFTWMWEELGLSDLRR